MWEHRLHCLCAFSCSCRSLRHTARRLFQQIRDLRFDVRCNGIQALVHVPLKGGGRGSYSTVMWTFVIQSRSFSNYTRFQNNIVRHTARHTLRDANTLWEGLNLERSWNRLCAMQPLTTNSSFSTYVCGSKLSRASSYCSTMVPLGWSVFPTRLRVRYLVKCTRSLDLLLEHTLEVEPLIGDHDFHR